MKKKKGKSPACFSSRPTWLYNDSNIPFLLKYCLLFLHIFISTVSATFQQHSLFLKSSLHLCSAPMTSRVSSVSSVSSGSSVSSIERRTVDSNRFIPTPAAIPSAHDAEQPRVNQVIDTVTEELLLSPRTSSHQEHLISNHELKDPVHTHQMDYGTRSWYYDWWFWEAAGALLSLGSTVAIVAMLAVCDNKPMPALRYGITLNAMLSVLSTVAKVSP